MKTIEAIFLQRVLSNKNGGKSVMHCALKVITVFYLFALVSRTFAGSAFAAPGEVVITHASMSTTAIPLWVTQRQGFFTKYGVKAQVVWVRGNPAQIATLASGDTQIAYGGATTALAAAVGGKDLKMIASLNSRETLDLVARPNIKRPEELRGKKFGIQSIGGGVWKTATVWLEHFGLDEKRDNIQMIVIGDVTVLSQAVETGRIDATVVPGFLSRRLAEKGFNVLGRSDKIKLPSIGMAVLVEPPYLQQNGDTLQNVMKALIEGMVFSASAKNKPAVLDTITKHFKLSDPAAAESAYQDIFALIHAEEYRKPYVSVDGLRALQRIMKTQNPKIGDINPDNLVDATIIRKIDQSGFFEKLYADYGVK